MSFSGYALTLFEPKVANLDEIPDEFTVDYFSMQFRKRWLSGRIDTSDDARFLSWSIPELDTGDEDNPLFCGDFSIAEKAITFGLTPHSTIATFIRWFRSIVPAEYPVYFFRISQFVALSIDSETTEEEIIGFLEH